MKRILKIVLIVIVVGLAVLFLARNFIARKSVEVGVKAMTGFPMEIGSVKVQPFRSTVEVKDMKLLNPDGFTEKLFVSLPSFFVDYRLGSMLKVEPHLQEVRINLEQINIVKNAQGESNVQKLKGVFESSDKSDKKTGESSAKYQIDLVKIHIGKVTYSDYTKATPTTKTTNLNLDLTYENISHSTDITKLVLMTVIRQAGIPDLGVDLKELSKSVKGATDAVTETGKGLFDTIKKAVPGSK
jgi:uncharacterized protein involved in outer membrane biogenesis